MRVKDKAARTLYSGWVLREGSEGGRSFILDCMRRGIQKLGNEENVASLGILNVGTSARVYSVD